VSSAGTLDTGLFPWSASRLNHLCFVGWCQLLSRDDPVKGVRVEKELEYIWPRVVPHGVVGVFRPKNLVVVNVGVEDPLLDGVEGRSERAADFWEANVSGSRY
jgi:hypothetical protein